MNNEVVVNVNSHCLFRKRFFDVRMAVGDLVNRHLPQIPLSGIWGRAGGGRTVTRLHPFSFAEHGGGTIAPMPQTKIPLEK